MQAEACQGAAVRSVLTSRVESKSIIKRASECVCRVEYTGMEGWQILSAMLRCIAGTHWSLSIEPSRVCAEQVSAETRRAEARAADHQVADEANPESYKALACSGYRASGYQAREYPHHSRWRGEDHRLRRRCGLVHRHQLQPLVRDVGSTIQVSSTHPPGLPNRVSPSASSNLDASTKHVASLCHATCSILIPF